MKGRLLDVTLGDPYSNLAAEEAIFRLMRVPTVRVWTNQKSVVIGRAQLASMETDMAYCAERGFPVVRRFTAGGAVYNGPGNVNWSFFAPKGARGSRVAYSADAKGVFRTFAGIVADALSACWVSASFQPPNRIVTEKGKVSGMAAYITSSGAVCHGTLLMNADVDEVERLTRPREAKVERKYPRSNFARVANSGVGRDGFVKALLDAADFDHEDDTLSREEEDSVARLLAEKYGTERWNLGDPFSLDYL
ncbi:MAG: lipoate--protein ligase family protein [Nitrososphaerales archaeon]|nr:lipoate--protein ligase family protein [Nitrososphaerales archaeon]